MNFCPSSLRTNLVGGERDNSWGAPEEHGPFLRTHWTLNWPHKPISHLNSFSFSPREGERNRSEGMGQRNPECCLQTLPDAKLMSHVDCLFLFPWGVADRCFTAAAVNDCFGFMKPGLWLRARVSRLLRWSWTGRLIVRMSPSPWRSEVLSGETDLECLSLFFTQVTLLMQRCYRCAEHGLWINRGIQKLHLLFVREAWQTSHSDLSPTAAKLILWPQLWTAP